MAHFWQHLPRKMNPVALHLGPIEASWYGIMYAIAFATVYFLVRHRVRSEKTRISLETVQDFFPWAIIGLLLGARLGDVFVYDWSYFRGHLSQIFLPFDIHNHWQYIGIYGMSYFGGLIGLVIAFYIFCKIKKICLLKFSDLFVPAIPLAYAFGRFGNFVNGELWGRATTVPWGMYFPADHAGQLRHPSQLYELFLEGILLFIVLWSIRKSPLVPLFQREKPSSFPFKKGASSTSLPLAKGELEGDLKWPTGYLTAFYLIGYGAARFTAEFFRQPDNDWFFLSLTIGQWFSTGIAIAGIIIIFSKKKGLLGKY